jgi:ABC-type phosphate transport system substrate-binding protein
MKWNRWFAVWVFVLLAIAPCFAHHMAVVVNKDNNVAELTPAHLAKLFRLEDRKWASGKDVVVVLHKDSAGEAATLERLSKMSGGEFKAFIASHKDAFTLVDSDDDVLRFVEEIPGAVGLVDVRSINDQVNVLRVGGKLPMEDGYLPH